MNAAEMASLAEQFAGELSERQRLLLPGLCRAAEAELRSRLRSDAEGYEEALGQATAWLALQRLQNMTGEPQSFTAGDFSVSRGSSGDVQRQALQMLRPWLAAETIFQKV